MLDVIGKRFGRLVVVELTERRDKRRMRVWVVCQCDCGGRKEVLFESVRSGDTKSCGCLSRELSAKRLTTHGLRKTPEYRIWKSIRNRCNNPNVGCFNRYGGRGIKVCERWNDFENFMSDMGERPIGMSIERIDNDGNYEPGNCKWATAVEQGQNKSTNVNITYRGKSRCIREWERHLGLRTNLIYERLKAGWSIKDAFERPLRNKIQSK